MKECKYCGTKYADNLLTCPSCGANVVVSEKEKIIEDAHKEKEIATVKEQIAAQKKEEKPKMAPGKKILIAMCSIAAVLVIVIIVTALSNNQPVTTDGKTNGDLKKEYETAMESMELGNYEKAIAELDGISTEYKDYDKVVDQREKAVEGYREQVLAQVDSYVAVGKHNDALSALEVAMNTHGETKELLQKKEEILYDYKQGIFSEVEKYADAGDYSTAIKRLRMLLDVIETDADTEMKIRYYEKAQVLKQVEVYESENDYVAAIEYLQRRLEELGQDADLATKLTSMYSAYKTSCMNTAKNYVADKDYTNAISVLEELAKVIGRDDEITTLTYDYKKALALEKIQSYIDNKDYLSGTEYVKKQIIILGEESTLSAKLKEMNSLYKEVVMKEAEKDVKDGKYASAVTALKSLLNIIGSDEEIGSEILEYRKKEINVKLTEYNKSKDYAGAISYLQNDVSETKTDEELKSKLEDYISKYKKDLFAKVEKTYETKGYSEAVKLLNSDKLMKNDAEVKEKIAYYNNKKPVLLNALKPYEYSLGYKNESIFDVVDAEYQGYFYSKTTGYKSKDEVVYFTNNEYEFFGCDLILVDANMKQYAREIVITDDETKEVLYHGALSTKDVDGLEIKINISSVKFLNIALIGCPKERAVMVNAQLIKK